MGDQYIFFITFLAYFYGTLSRESGPHLTVSIPPLLYISLYHATNQSQYGRISAIETNPRQLATPFIASSY